MLAAERDIHVVGRTVSAALSFMAKAGNDVNMTTTTSTSRGGGDANGYANTPVDRMPGSDECFNNPCRFLIDDLQDGCAAKLEDVGIDSDFAQVLKQWVPSITRACM